MNIDCYRDVSDPEEFTTGGATGMDHLSNCVENI